MTGEKLDLDVIQARADAATPGPWTVRRWGNDWGWSIDMPNPELDSVTEVEEYHEAAAVDVEFIATARTDVPALVARVRELEAAIRQHKANTTYGTGRDWELWSHLNSTP